MPPRLRNLIGPVDREVDHAAAAGTEGVLHSKQGP